MRPRTWALSGLVLAGVVLAGCSGTSTGGGGSAADRAVTNGAAAAPSAASGERAAQSATDRPLVTGETKIRTATLSVTVADRAAVGAHADEAATLAERVGGEVESEDRGSTYASLRLRVPPARLSSSLRTLSKYGTATSQQLGVRDVTAQVVDVSSRVRSAEQAIARLRTLYTSATKVTDVIAVEQQLSSREADLESLQAQQRALAKQTSLATISLSLRAASAAPPADRGGFLGGLADGWKAFTRALAALAFGIGTALPFLVVLAVFAVAGLLVRRRRRSAPEPATE